MAIQDTSTKAARAAELRRAALIDWGRTLVICVVAAAFMAFTGAFDTGQEESLLWRLSYWTVVMLIGGTMGTLISRPFFASPRFADRGWLACALVVVVLTPPLTVVVWGASNIFFGNNSWNPIGLLYTLGPVAVVSAVMTAIFYMAEHRPRETHAAVKGAPPPRFLNRLPARLRGAKVLAVEAEDHYLRVHTDRGSDLILMRLSDAITELEGIEGAQTHRSWWVAKDAVIGVERGDGRAVFELQDGARAPVSRTYARLLREAGWY